MLNVAFDSGEYEFSSVEECDINTLYKWIKENNNEDNVSILDEDILYRRFLEYYITDDEFFVKVLKNKEVECIIKGSIDRGRKKELFLWLFVVKKENRNKGEGKKIMSLFSRYMCEKYTLENIKAGVYSSNKKALNFWKSIGFKVYRITKKFFRISETNFENLIIMDKEKRII